MREKSPGCSRRTSIRLRLGPDRGTCREPVLNSRIVKTNTVRLFVKPYCGWCRQAMRWLDDHDVKYEVIDVIANDAGFDEMFRLSGQELAPVIDVNGQVLADFGPEDLERFWSRLSHA